MKHIKHMVRSAFVNCRKINPKAGQIIAFAVLMPVVISCQLAVDAQREPSQAPTTIEIDGTEIKAEYLVYAVVAAAGITLFSYFVSSGPLSASRGIQNPHLYLSRTKWLMRVGAFNSLIGGGIWGLSAVVVIVVATMLSQDFISLFIHKGLAERAITEGNLLQGMLVTSAIAGGLFWVFGIVGYIADGCSAVGEHKGSYASAHNMKVCATNRFFCLLVGLLFAPPVLLPFQRRRALRTAKELMLPELELLKRPWYSITSENREKEVLAELYPDIFGDGAPEDLKTGKK